MKRALIVFLLFTFSAFAAPEKWFDAYSRGVKAVNAKNYAAGAEALQKAISEMPNEGTGVRAGNSLITYVPHFWLGIAKFNLGDVEGALREFKISEDQGIVARTEYYSGMKDWIARAQTERVRKAEGAAKGAKSSADGAISRALATQVEALSTGGDRTETYRTAQRKLQEALGQFHKAGTNIETYKSAEATAVQARDLFMKSAEEAKQLKLARANAPKPAPPKPAAAKPVVVASVTPPPVVTQTVPPPQPVVEQKPSNPAATQQPTIPTPEVESEASVTARIALQRYRGTISSAQRGDRGNAAIQGFLREEAREADRLRQRLEKTKDDGERQRIASELTERDRGVVQRITELRVAAATAAALENPPSAKAGLEAAYRAYAAGDLTSSEQLLTKLVGEAPSGEALLLRGCARYTRAMLSRTPETLLAEAASDFRAALAKNRRLRLDQSLFSPKLVAFFEQVRQER